jgi:deoxyribonuclease-4
LAWAHFSIPLPRNSVLWIGFNDEVISMVMAGVHVSIAGGISESVSRASRISCASFQIFTQSSRTWDFPEFTDEEVEAFRSRCLLELSGAPFLIHASYLINVATPRPDLILKSSITLNLEWELANRLGALGLVLHPGSSGGAPIGESLERASEMISSVVERRISGKTKLLIENTAGAGHTLGRSPEEIARIMELVDQPEKMGVCLDSCHLLASGYEIRNESGYLETISRFLDAAPNRKVDAFHLNDAYAALGSARDRHTHIGIGHIGPWFFWRLLHDQRFYDIPMVLETPKKEGTPEDVLNLAVIRRLAEMEHPPEKKDPVLDNLIDQLREFAPK